MDAFMDENLKLGHVRHRVAYRVIPDMSLCLPRISTTLRLCTRRLCIPHPRRIHVSSTLRNSSFTNILADENPPPVQVKSITNQGINLADGLTIPSACIFLEGKIFLWDVPSTLWAEWTKDHFEIFETIIPRPGTHLVLHVYFSCSSRRIEILLLGTGPTLSQIPLPLRSHLNQLGIQVDVMDTVRSCPPIHAATQCNW